MSVSIAGDQDKRLSARGGDVQRVSLAGAAERILVMTRDHAATGASEPNPVLVGPALRHSQPHRACGNVAKQDLTLMPPICLQGDDIHAL
jgi:hypothetical protein